MEREKLKIDKIDGMSLEEVRGFIRQFEGNDKETKVIIGLKLGLLYSRRKISGEFLIEEKNLPSNIVCMTYYLPTLENLRVDTYEKVGRDELKFKSSIFLSNPGKVADNSGLILDGAKKNMKEIEKKSREIFQKP